MAPDHSRSSTLGSSGAPPGSPGAVLTGAGSVCTMATLLPTRSASQRKHVSDLLAMVGDNTETMRVILQEFQGPASWPLGRAIHEMGELGIITTAGSIDRHAPRRCLGRARPPSGTACILRSSIPRRAPGGAACGRMAAKARPCQSELDESGLDGAHAGRRGDQQRP